jgi:hypothetical protein
MLIRAQNLQEIECRNLPHPCVPIKNGNTKIVYAELEGLTIRDQFKIVYQLGQVVQGGEIVYHDPSAPLTDGAELGQPNPPRFSYPIGNSDNSDKPKEFSEDIIDADIIDDHEIPNQESVIYEEPDFWQLVSSEKYDDAFASIKNVPPDWSYEQRIKLLTFLDSENIKLICFACRVIILLDWRSNVVRIRKLLHHESPEVRKSALAVIGEFAGASLLPSIQILLNDPDPEVVVAANRCYQKVNKR